MVSFCLQIYRRKFNFKGDRGFAKIPPPKGGDREVQSGREVGRGERFALGIEDPSPFKSQQHCVVFEQKKLTNGKKETKVSIFQLKHLIFCLIARMYSINHFLRFSKSFCDGRALLCLRRRGFADLVKPDSLLLLLLFGSLHRFRSSFGRQRGGGRGKIRRYVKVRTRQLGFFFANSQE